jgi:serine/threonine protein kinase
MLFILLTGKIPFFGAYEEDLYRKIIQAKYLWPCFLTDKKGIQMEHSDGAKRLVKRILNPDPNRRPTAEQILADGWL